MNITCDAYLFEKKKNNEFSISTKEQKYSRTNHIYVYLLFKTNGKVHSK